MMRLNPLAALGFVAVLALPIAGNADPLSIFQPTQVRAISVTPADARALHALPPLDAFGSIRGTRSPALDEVNSAIEAAQRAGFDLRLPSNIPAVLAGDVHYQVTQRAKTSFTFDGKKAAGWARQHKVALTALPTGLNGATYTATLEPVAIVTYGTVPRKRDQRVRRGTFLAVVQAPVPTVTARGASLRTLADWFAAQPGIPRGLVAQIKAIGDPTQTLPIPIRFDKQTAAKVTVDGVSGLAIGDETGIGSTVVWLKHGKLYAVGGTFAQSQVLGLAENLK